MAKKNAKSKPLRTSSNTIKDLYNTYIKNSDDKEIENMKNNANIETDLFDDMPDILTQDMNDDVKEFLNIGEENPDESKSKENSAEVSVTEKLEKERDELKNQVMRMAAEMENLRKRSQKEKYEMVDYANERLLFQMLPILDDLSNALKSVNEKTEFKTFLSGVEMIYTKTVKMFENASVKEMDDPIGQAFDVDLHDAVLAMPSEYPEGEVCQLAQPGYMMKTKVLRHAKVVTSQGPATD